MSNQTGQQTLFADTPETSMAAEKAPKVKEPKEKPTEKPTEKPKAPKEKEPQAKGAVNAETMAKKQREISVSEFFTKNRHLLGFDSPRKALLTAVKEAIDNSLDA